MVQSNYMNNDAQKLYNARKKIKGVLTDQKAKAVGYRPNIVRSALDRVTQPIRNYRPFSATDVRTGLKSMFRK